MIWLYFGVVRKYLRGFFLWPEALVMYSSNTLHLGALARVLRLCRSQVKSSYSRGGWLGLGHVWLQLNSLHVVVHIVPNFMQMISPRVPSSRRNTVVVQQRFKLLWSVVTKLCVLESSRIELGWIPFRNTGKSQFCSCFGLCSNTNGGDTTLCSQFVSLPGFKLQSHSHLLLVYHYEPAVVRQTLAAYRWMGPCLSYV